ncbi:ABC transporter ATP-binding protein [Gorillibacterium timonense]|uniref:ABC transporter ATP-binding protein n=1 Tax=Gorillibacterium timonense TaxID=1689269 RepID=UPI00071DF50B|nr:ABC transporter ATP-binding protein [Gorillibacterium timonense]
MKDILRYVKQLVSYSGAALYANMAGMIAISLLDGIGLILLIPMLGISGIISYSASNHTLFQAFSFLQGLSGAAGLLTVLGIFVILALVQNGLQRQFTVRNARIHQSFYHHLRFTVYRDLLYADWGFYLKRRRSDIVNTMTSELTRVGAGINLFLALVTNLLFTAIQVVIAVWLSLQVTVFVVVCGLALAFLSKRALKKAMALGKRTTDMSQSYLAGITEQINGIKDIKSNRLEASRLDWMKSESDKLQKEQDEYVLLRSNSQLLYKLASALLIAFFLYASIAWLKTPPEQLILVVAIFSRLWPRFMSIQMNLEQLSSSIPAFRSLKELQERCRMAGERIGAADSEPLRLKEEITLEDVSFRYDRGSGPYALSSIKITIPANRMTAIVGRSGAGKSTLADLIMGLIVPEEGQICVDGEPLEGTNIRKFRQSVSYVSQDPFLFNASIRDNLLLVEPNADDSRIWEALELAAAAEFVTRLPMGLDTVLGDRGVRLSGGERQRLVLARALLRNPSILVLDEATSALDNENESRIQDALFHLRGKITLIVIAHRLSTIRDADQVIVLDQGAVVQCGEYSSLAREKRGMFRRLLGMQRGDDSIHLGEGERYDWRSN